MSSFLRDIQTEHPNLVSRWLLTEQVGPLIYDDIGGFQLIATGTPSYNLPSLCKGDRFSSVQGGYSAQVNGWEAPVEGFDFSDGVMIEAITARDPNGTEFSVFYSPGQARLQINGANVVFTVWTTASHALTATGPIIGYPQHVVGIYDPVAQLQQIYVDGVLVASQALSGVVADFAFQDITLTETGSPSGGHFTLTYESQTTGNISYAATYTNVVSALNLLSNSNGEFGSGAGGPLPGTAITLSGPGGTLTADSSGLTGGTMPAVEVVQISQKTQILTASASSACVASGQDIGIYNGPLSSNAIKQHFQAFAQIWPDPGHTASYSNIGVTQ